MFDTQHHFKLHVSLPLVTPSRLVLGVTSPLPKVSGVQTPTQGRKVGPTTGRRDSSRRMEPGRTKRDTDEDRGSDCRGGWRLEVGVGTVCVLLRTLRGTGLPVVNSKVLPRYRAGSSVSPVNEEETPSITGDHWSLDLSTRSSRDRPSQVLGTCDLT